MKKRIDNQHTNYAKALDKLVEMIEGEQNPTFFQLATAAGLNPATDFRKANLANLDFRDEDLRGFDFSGADLTGVDFRRANVKGVSFTEAVLVGAIGLVGTEENDNSSNVKHVSITQRVKHQIIHNQPIDAEEGATIKTLKLGNSRVRDISALTWLPNLTNLSVMNTPISDLSVLENLSHLEELFLDGSKVTDLGPVAWSRGLRVLTARNVIIKDLSPLDSLEFLERLYIQSWTEIDLLPLSGLHNLRNLQMHANKFYNTGALHNLRKLVNLSLFSLSNEDFSDVGNLTSLKTLTINMPGCNFSLDGFSRLEYLHINGASLNYLPNNLASLSSLTITCDDNFDADSMHDNWELESIDINNPKMSLLAKLVSIHLKSVTLRGSVVTEEFLNYIPKWITSLRLEGTSISNIDAVVLFQELRFVSFVDSPVDDVTRLRELKNLTAVDLRGTRVEDIEHLVSLNRFNVTASDGNSHYTIHSINWDES